VSEERPTYQGDAAYDGIACPQCKSTDLTESWTSHTLVGYSGGPENDGNHWKTPATCNACGVAFTKHWVPRDKNAWYTQGSYVVKGDATCCGDGYWQPCHCGGWMRHLVSLSGKGFRSFGQEVDDKGNETGRCVPGQPMGWKCIDCDGLFPDERWGDEFLHKGGKLKPWDLVKPESKTSVED
jgi:hypothetical protein